MHLGVADESKQCTILTVTIFSFFLLFFWGRRSFLLIVKEKRKCGIKWNCLEEDVCLVCL